jgi:hypothetical protein
MRVVAKFQRRARVWDTLGVVPAPSERERHAWIPQAVESLAYSGHPGRSAFRDRLQRAGVVQAFVQPPRARSGPEAAGARDCTNDCAQPSHLTVPSERPRWPAVYAHQVVIL